ncbi:methyltransferase [Altererythrobacter salegens]|uniref:Methyltransferase n=1 Tax=Croceibacterium salegens TaxID=1737568 RepID=A0A6I4SWE0_9SPHN|nr:protein-glutamate O-methyltransferase CheR [Croceibacterium salegens]MXO59808.1 methyltransferase [Croceibacterium salegens]
MDPDDLAIGIIAGLLEARTGQRLTEDRRWRIAPALSGLFRERGISSHQDLVVLLTQPDESSLAQDVVEALLNNETYFFRDRGVFDYISDTLLPRLASARAKTKKLSIWSVGCSTGQETLSLAMMFAEQGKRWDGWEIEILGTDVSSSVLEFAREATYSNFQIQRGLSVAQMLANFTETSEGWKAHYKLRDQVRYEVHNVLHPAPYPGRFDLILCRNVLLYFDNAVRDRAFSRLSEALSEGGRLVLGGGETVLGRSGWFVPDEERQAVYVHGPAAGSASKCASAA